MPVRVSWVAPWKLSQGSVGGGYICSLMLWGSLWVCPRDVCGDIFGDAFGDVLKYVF